MRDTNVVVIAGGSFQGKSLIALRTAARFNFSGVISTDTVRNFLKAVNPNKEHLSTSSYLLAKESFERQVDEVSTILTNLLPIYMQRGEHIIIEGMHFSADFLAWAATADCCRIFLNNQRPLTDRVLLKSITRSKLGVYEHSGTTRTFGAVNHANISRSSYVAHQERIQEIQLELLERCQRSGFAVVTFDQLEEGYAQVENIVTTWLSSM